MKKIYNSPKTTIVEVKMDSLLVQYSNSEASSTAVSLSREGGNGGSSWDDEE